MKRSTWGKGVKTIKTSIEIPEELWTAAKIRAVHDKTNLQDVIAVALREHLKKARKGRERNEG